MDMSNEVAFGRWIWTLPRPCWNICRVASCLFGWLACEKESQPFARFPHVPSCRKILLVIGGGEDDLHSEVFPTVSGVQRTEYCIQTDIGWLMSWHRWRLSLPPISSWLLDQEWFVLNCVEEEQNQCWGGQNRGEDVPWILYGGELEPEPGQN